MGMQTWKKEIKRLGIVGLLFFFMVGMCGCQQPASDVPQPGETQVEKEGMEDKENALASGSEEGIEGQTGKTPEEYITPDDVTEEELSSKEEAVQEDTDKGADKQSSYNQTYSKKKDTKDKDASVSHGDKNKTKDKEEKSLGKKNSNSSSNDEDLNNSNTQDNSAAEEKQDFTNAKDASANQSGETYCSFTIECKEVLKHKDKLKKNKRGLIPENGIIYSNSNTVFSDGESVFDILLRVTKNNKIQMEYNYTPAFQSNYIEGIANLYEFDCGETSGWSYLVNGQSPSYGCNRYKVNVGDDIIWRYTCGN